jgi:hypothetical protein
MAFVAAQIRQLPISKMVLKIFTVEVAKGRTM